MNLRNDQSARSCHGYSLIEISVVIAVASIVMLAGIHGFTTPVTQARKASVDQLIRAMDQARATAVARRMPVVLALAEPGDLAADDPVYQIGIFLVKKEQTAEDESIYADQLVRWKPLHAGVFLAKRGLENLPNVMGSEKVNLRYGTDGSSKEIRVHVLEFNAHGGLKLPAGSGPVMVRVAELRLSTEATEREDMVKIGRVAGRAYRF